MQANPTPLSDRPSAHFETRRATGTTAKTTSNVSAPSTEVANDATAFGSRIGTDDARRLTRADLKRVVPFFLLHLACLSVFWVGVSWAAIGFATLTFFGRVFGLTAFYHRYFSHRAFRTSRWFQFVGAVLGNSAGQRGPLWWAAHHRDHHRHSDTSEDAHSPHVHGFWWSHMGWFMNRENFHKDRGKVKDFHKFPELRFLDRYDFLAPLALATFSFFLGELMRGFAPALGTTGPQMFVWGFLLSTVLLYHVTYAVNSLAHTVGTRRFATKDESRNNFWLALITFGEGWHNNHHHYPSSARQGFYWWEIDITYYLLRLLASCGIVWELRPVPERVLNEGRASRRDLRRAKLRS